MSQRDQQNLHEEPGFERLDAAEHDAAEQGAEPQRAYESGTASEGSGTEGGTEPYYGMTKQ